MSSRSWALRVVIGSALPLLTGLVVVALVVGREVDREHANERRATSTATGTITAVDGDTVTVSWQDQRGADRTTSFVLDSGDGRRAGQPFHLHYDPATPAHAYGDLSEDPYPRSDDLDGGRSITWLGAGVLVLLVCGRLLLWRRGRRRPLTDALGLPVTLRSGAFQVVGLAVWPPSAATGDPAAAAMTLLWVPQLRRWGPNPLPVQLHGRIDQGRISAVQTPVGELFALGRVRRKKLPGGAVLPPLPVPVATEATPSVDENGFPVEQRPWWRAPVTVLAYAAFPIAGAIGFRNARHLALLALLVLAPTAAIWAWGFFAISPDRPGLRDTALLSGVDVEEDEEEALARIGRDLDLSVPQRVVHELFAERREQADALAPRLEAAGYDVKVVKLGRHAWGVLAAKSAVVDTAYLTRARAELEAVADLHAGVSYDGWHLEDVAVPAS